MAETSRRAGGQPQAVEIAAAIMAATGGRDIKVRRGDGAWVDVDEYVRTAPPSPAPTSRRGAPSGLEVAGLLLLMLAGGFALLLLGAVALGVWGGLGGGRR